MWRFCPVTQCIIINNPTNGSPNEIYTGGCRYWRQNTKIYRPNDMPSRIRPDGLKVWTDPLGQYHRDGGKPARQDSYKVYFNHGTKLSLTK
jgi:hypothetical protein